MAQFKVILSVERVGASDTPGATWSMTFQDNHSDGDNTRYDVSSISEGIRNVTKLLNQAVTSLTPSSQLGKIRCAHVE